MKKIVSALLLVMLLVALTACGKQEATQGASTADNQTHTGVISDVRADMLILEPQSKDGFDLLFAVDPGVAGIADLRVGDKVTVTYTGELESIDAAPVAVAVEKVGS